MENAVGGDGAKPARRGQIEKIERMAVALPGEMPLHFDEGPVLAEERNERIDGCSVGAKGHQTLQQLRLVETRAARSDRGPLRSLTAPLARAVRRRLRFR